MKHINQFITEYIIKKKLDKPIDSEDHYEYFPKTKEELIENIKELLNKGETDLNCIDTSAITDMSYLFRSLNISTTIDVSKWNVSNVTNMDFMFGYCYTFNGNLSNWDVSNVEDMSCMFNGCQKFEGKGIENWDVHNVKNMYCLFNDCIKFKGKSIENWNVSNVENMAGIFYKCKKLDCDLSNWNVSKVEIMDYMFKGCYIFKGKGLENWNTNNLKDMREIFYGCSLIENKPSWYKE